MPGEGLVEVVHLQTHAPDAQSRSSKAAGKANACVTHERSKLHGNIRLIPRMVRQNIFQQRSFFHACHFQPLSNTLCMGVDCIQERIWRHVECFCMDQPHDIGCKPRDFVVPFP